MFDRKKTIEGIVENIYSLKRKMGQESRTCFANSKMTHTQWLVIKLVHQQKSVNLKEIAENLGATSSAATQLVEGLVKNGYLKRSSDENDRRLIKIVLSDKAKNHVEEIKKKVIKEFASIFEALDDKELGEYYELNKKLLN